uniref:Putative TDP-sugar 2,3-dehydratase n=1 Tax=Streptomyces versipellis TaxID=67375 RepID=A0A0B6VP92_9ACTN|nr:putative TDP-sugar 2,3-dehydratase [Streptomyces versipellis]
MPDLQRRLLGWACQKLPELPGTQPEPELGDCVTGATSLSYGDTWRADSHIASQFTSSAMAADPSLRSTSDFQEWWESRRNATRFSAEQVPFGDLEGWRFERDTGNLTHESGRFFVVQGLRITTEQAGSWSQPIINQSEIGILGILVKEFNGVLHCLMQAKAEPGNINGLQLSPTVQATRSNYTRVHGGANTRYLEYFRGDRRGQTLVDSLQSEQGAWFWHKRNRNIVVRTDEDVPLHDDFHWLTLRQLRKMLTVENLVNMDSRTVLACIPYARPQGPVPTDADPYTQALLRSYGNDGEDPDGYDDCGGSLHTLSELLSWFTEAKTRCGWTAQPIPLAEVTDWSRTSHAIVDDENRRFQVIGVSVDTDNREVSAWTQPLLAPTGTGLAAFVTKAVDGVLHVLARARAEPGLLDVVELGPTVRRTSAKDTDQDEPFFEYVTTVDSRRIRYDTVLSEEGGRFHHARTRYLVVEADDTFPADIPDDYRWVTVQQLTTLLRHPHYVNIEARSLLACLHSLW